MKKNTKTYKIPSTSFWLVLLGVPLFLLGFFNHPSGAEETKQVAILPLVINASEKMDYLREGIEDMLSSRLTWEDKVVVLNRSQVQKAMVKMSGPVDESRALQIGKQLGVEVVLWGSINVFGSSISLDLNLLDIPLRQPSKKFFAQAKGMDEVILKINDISDTINEKVFARAKAAPALASAAPTGGQQPKSSEAPSSEPAAEKARLSLKGFIINPLSPQIIMNAGGFDMAGVWKSTILPFALIDMAFGDLDGDGKIEAVLISKDRIYIYRYVQDKFEFIKEIPGDRWDNYHAVDVGDINGTGRPQIFISNYQSNRLRSKVLSWENGDYKIIAKNIPFHLRIHQLPGRSPVLLGQPAFGDKPFDTTKIQILSWKDGGYVPVERLKLPEGLTVFNFAYLDLKDGSPKILYLSSNNRLNIAAENGKLEYSSSDFFGGTINHVAQTEVLDDLPTAPKMGENTLFYIPARLVMLPGSSPGKTEIILNKNKSSFFDIFSRYRAYNSGEIYSLSYEGGTMRENWRTQPIADYIANYGVADFKNNGQKQLVVGVVQSTGLPIVAGARSVLYCYDLGGAKPGQK
jgi:hypothetical protein